MKTKKPLRSEDKEIGLTREIVGYISEHKNEPEWMRDFRLNSLEVYESLDLPTWGPCLNDLNLNDLSYFTAASGKKKTWDEVPNEVKDTFEKLGIPQAERAYLAGVEAQYDSEAVYGSLMAELDEKGIIFTDMDTAVKKYSDILQEYFATLVPINDNKFSALNSAVWSGGSFVYIPKNVQVSKPIQAYFRINSRNMGQFERTVIVAEEGSSVHYVEGCTAPIYPEYSLHAAVVEVFVKKNAQVRYTTIQNWSNNIFNLVTKRANVESNGRMTWIDGNLGSKVTMKYPACILSGEGAYGEMYSLSYASKGQIQDTGAKMIHRAKNTKSFISSKSVSLHGGHASYRGFIDMSAEASDSKAHSNCDSLMLDSESSVGTIPFTRNSNKSSNITHEATISKLDENKLYYLESRGFDAENVRSMLISGFIEPVIKELPLEYAVEFNELVNLDMKGSTA